MRIAKKNEMEMERNSQGMWVIFPKKN